MTIFGPDLSNYESGITLQPGTVFVIAKASEGTYYKDASYANFQAQAAHIGALFSGYHFLTTEDVTAQAKLYFSVAGATPCMLDVEPTQSFNPTVDTALAFKKALEGLGGRVWAAYFPAWYQSEVGGNLGALQSAGAVIISSTYTGYTDTGSGWNKYGGMNEPPALWQYTNSQSYGGKPCDFNAFKGTVDELAHLVNGTSMDLSTPVPTSPAMAAMWPELAALGFGPNQAPPLGTVLIWMAARIAHLTAEFDQVKGQLSAGNVNPAAVADAELAEIKAKL